MRSRMIAGAILLALAASATAAPIRVGILTGVGQGRFWHTNQHTAASVITTILANPDSATIGPDLVIHPAGFSVTRFGLVSGTGTPTVAQRQAFVDALDSLDVIVFTSNTDVGGIFTDPLHRQKLEEFWKRKGMVSIHFTTDSYGSWPTWDSLHGTRFQNHPPADRQATIRLDSIGAQDADGNWMFLNRGLPDTARFLEEWISFTTNGDVIRASPGLKMLVNVDESSYAGGMGGARAMGADHPMSWYRQLSEGGRFFYTALGHRAQHYTGTGSETSPPTYFLRRQLYNAILWSAGYNNDGTITNVKQGKNGGAALASRFADHAQLSLSGGTLTVSLLHNGAHTIEITSLDGRRIDSRRGAGKVEHRFKELGRGAAYIVEIRTAGEKFSRMIGFP